MIDWFNAIIGITTLAVVGVFGSLLISTMEKKLKI